MQFDEYLTSLPLLHTFDGGQNWCTGGFLPDHLAKLHAFLSQRLPINPTILETGAGNSTICFLFLDPARLIAIAPSSDLFDRIRQFCETNAVPIAPLRAHIDGSQWVLPRLAAESRDGAPFLDFALIDGLHNWPAVFLDFFYVNYMLREGGFLMIDDVQLHSVKELARLLSEQPGFELELDLGKALVFRKTSAERELPEWVLQPYVWRLSEQYSTWSDPFALEPQSGHISNALPTEEDLPSHVCGEFQPRRKLGRWMARVSAAFRVPVGAGASDRNVADAGAATRDSSSGITSSLGRPSDSGSLVLSPFSDFEPYIVRKDSIGVEFNYLVGDETARLWYDTPRSPAIAVGEARSLSMRVKRGVTTDWREMQIIRDHIVLPGSRVLECGSHQGLTTVLFAAWSGPAGFVYAFDAVLFNALVTRRNLEINGITNAAAYCAAIGAARGLVNLYDESNVIVRQDEYVKPASAVMVRLEDVIHGDVDALKLDIEGSELAVVESSAELIRRIPRLAIEVHTDLLPQDGFDRLITALCDRPIYLLDELNRFGPYMGQAVKARVHLFSF
jgi:FkbM family methyltransferase